MIKITEEHYIKSMCIAIWTKSNPIVYYWLQLYDISILPFLKKFSSHLVKIFIKKAIFLFSIILCLAICYWEQTEKKTVLE